MSLSMHQASALVFTRMLGNLSSMLDKAAASAQERKIDPAVLINARLAPDMFPLSRQIQIASDAAKVCMARLAGLDIPSYPDIEVTFDELKARIAKTVEFVDSVPTEQVDEGETRAITLKLPSGELNFTGKDFLLIFALPNFYFHFTASYTILRHNGVPLGKLDYLGGMPQAEPTPPAQ